MLPGHSTLNNRMGSTGHKANVPDKDFREIGIWAAKGTHESCGNATARIAPASEPALAPRYTDEC